MTRVTMQVAQGQAAQQASIDDWARSVGNNVAAVVAEGAFHELVAPPGITVERLGAGCVCCVGLVPLRVALTRLLRRVRPSRILLLIADASHVDRVRALLGGGGIGVSIEVDT